MADFSEYRGIGQFGRAYQIMLENDTNAPGSVQRVLVERMVRLCADTAAHLYQGYAPIEIDYQGGARPELERYVQEATADCGSNEERVDAIAKFCTDLGKEANEDLDTMVVGGTEEEIIHRGSDWCTDLARVGCVLCQVAGLPARLVNLFDTEQAYSGHVIIEAYRRGVWGAVDTTTAVTYRRRNGNPASTWELMNQPELIRAHWKDRSTFYARVGQFRGAAISNYFVWESDQYDYTISGINDYCRSILEMSIKEWPGGLRWLHGEDTA